MFDDKIVADLANLKIEPNLQFWNAIQLLLSCTTLSKLQSCSTQKFCSH